MHRRSLSRPYLSLRTLVEGAVVTTVAGSDIDGDTVTYAIATAMRLDTSRLML